MKKFAIVFVMAAIVMWFAACKYDNSEDLYPVVCDTTEVVTYSGTIQPLLAIHCYECHNEANYVNEGDSKLLEGYDYVYDKAVDSSLLGSIKHMNGYEPMPEDGEQLDPCDIKKFEKWIADGAPNN